MKDPAELTLTEVAGSLRRRTFSSTELTRWMLERIARWQPAINAFVRVEEDEALAVAKHGRARHAGINLLEKLQPFRADAVFEPGKAGRVAAWPGEARPDLAKAIAACPTAVRRQDVQQGFPQMV